MERIHVSVRPRPLLAEDEKSSPWRISANAISIPNTNAKFEFDQIFGEYCKTYDVYAARTKDIVAASVRGFNGTVFAYGQTSSGKTHTMRGSNFEPGIIPLAVHDLFNIIHQASDREFLLRMSYMEIYNEEINDLLAPEHRKLQIHESIERGIFVAGLREEIVASADQVLDLMKFGESHRHIGETNMNVYSSRSHTIFRMIIESRERSNDGEAEFSCDAVRVSVLNLVDLAGSERASKTGAEGVRLKEGSHINKSLMTLGTVIKKLSEGAESQGGHVPYRDSKLTRILQPSLGGNANTAIICNITLAQIHADETKSSLMFASRALHVTNCAYVNEILTDAALLKRQKKEIEELRAKLQGSKSEHLEEEILNLRNTLLKSEVERERIALELEEEKRAQAEREKRLLEQAKKIENLSSMVFGVSREETSDVYKKEKRRDTWCPGNLMRKKMKEIQSVVKEKTSEVKKTKADREAGPLVPFNELINETSVADICKEEKDCKSRALDQCDLPDPQALLHVTNRRKVPLRKRSLLTDINNSADIQVEFENLFLEFETHRIISDVQIDYLTRKLAEADCVINEKCRELASRNINSISLANEYESLTGINAILVIKQLQEKIASLELEKSSSQQNVDCVVDLAAELSSQAKCEKLYKQLVLAQEEVTLARDRLALSHSSSMEESDWLNNLSTQTQEIQREFEDSKVLIGTLLSIVDELFHVSSLTPTLDQKASSFQSLVQVESIIGSHKMIQSCFWNKIGALEDEKRVLYNQVSEFCQRIEELSVEVQDSGNVIMELNKKYEAKKAEHEYQLQILQKEILSLSSSSLVKEKDSIRKDLEKTKSKLKDTEFKLKNAMQEKTKLEGEKSCADRELKKLQSQNALLERDTSKRASVIGRRCDSTIDRGANVFDIKRGKGSNSSAGLEEYKQLEVLAFDMETTIASLEDQLTAANEEKDIANSKAECLAFELQSLSDELQLSNSELDELKEEALLLRTELEEKRVQAEKMENSLKILSGEKDDLSMQLTEALMTLEEEKAIWSSKEKASMECIVQNERHYKAEIASLSAKLSEATDELQIRRQNIKDLEECLHRLEESAASEKQCRCFSKEEVVEDNITSEQRAMNDPSKGSLEVSNLQLESKCRKAHEEIEMLQLELGVLQKERQYLLAQVQELESRQSVFIDESQVPKLKSELDQQRVRFASMEDKMRNDDIAVNKEKAKLRMKLRGTQAKLEAFRVRYQQLCDEFNLMNRKFEEASSNLKRQLASCGGEILEFKKQLASCRCRKQ